MSIAEVEEAIEMLRLSLNDTEHDCFQMCEGIHPVDMFGMERSISDVQARMRDLHQAFEKLAALQRNDGRLVLHDLGDPAIRRAVWDTTGGTCVYCDVALTDNIALIYAATQFHIDHIVAKANGGPDHLANYVPSCRSCNIKKGTRSFVDFYWSMKRGTPHLKVIEGGGNG